MGKLVLYLADGTTKDVVLDRERITIGRRADNDVCLPFPAVSGEHAQVVTILADSFLEDLGSTNGTLVNGKTVTKHFLSDYDQIDIGRQRLTYMSDNDARVDPLPPDLLRHQLRGLTEKVEPARPLPQVEVPAAGDHRPHSAARGMLIADLERGARHAGPPSQMRTPGGPPSRMRTPGGPNSKIRTPTGSPSKMRAPPAAPAPSAALVAAADAQPSARAAMPAAPPARPQRSVLLEADVPVAAPPDPRGPSVRVLSGPSIGRTVAFPNRELTVGRVGVQVAVVRKVDGGYRLVPLEGASPPRINGTTVAPDGSPLHPGDTFEVAGVRLELSADA